MTKRTDRQIKERIAKTASFASMFSRENEYTWKIREMEGQLAELVDEAEEEPESALWYAKAIARTETAIQYLKELEAERRKYDELRSHITALMNVY